MSTENYEIFHIEEPLLPINKQDALPQRIYILSFDITKLPHSIQFILLSGAVFVFYLGVGYFQEFLFQLDGMKPFGWYLTFIQFGIYSFISFIRRSCFSRERDMIRRIPLKIYTQLAFYTVVTMGLSNASTGYLNYPTQIIFKCCKLIPVLIGGILIQGKKYGFWDIFAAILMTFGLILFSLGDSQVSPNLNPKGYIMISFALVADAIIGNVQEKSMKHYNAQNNEVVLFSYSIGCIYIFVILLITGELFDGFEFYLKNPWETYGYSIIFSLLGYAGINVVLTMIRISGALTTVTVTTARKAVTIIISFLLFSKPFTFTYVWAGLFVLAAIYMNLYSKNKAKMHELMASRLHRL